MAKHTAAFIGEQQKSHGVLNHSYHDGSGNKDAFASDYVFLAKGYWDLYSATLDGVWLRESVQLLKTCRRLYWDERRGGLMETTADPFSAPFAVKGLDERDIPSVNGLALELFCLLSFVSGEKEWQVYADRIVKSSSSQIMRAPEQYPSFLTGFSRSIESLRKVVVVGKKDASDTRSLVQAAQKCYAPETTVLLKDDILSDLFPMLAAMRPVNGKAAAYICDSAGCYAPLTQAEDLYKELSKPPALIQTS